MHPCVTRTFQAFQPQDLPKALQSFSDIPVFPVFPVFPDIPVIPDTPETFRTFQSFMTFQPLPGNSTSSSISRDSNPFQHSPIRMHILHILRVLQILQFDWFPQKTPPSTSWAITITNVLQTFILQRKGDVVISVKRASVKIVKIDIFSRIELSLQTSCHQELLITRMTFNSFLSCLMSKVSIEITINTSKWHERTKQWNGNSQISSHS